MHVNLLQKIEWCITGDFKEEQVREHIVNRLVKEEPETEKRTPKKLAMKEERWEDDEL